MTESLYRKYRPQTFADVVGQDAIERTLRNALAQNKVSHAYLFCGPRGTGKTTTARLMAKAILCDKGVTPDPDGTCESCKLVAEGRHPDVYELDAASRTGVDNVREEIIGRVNFAPTVGRAKIYIIDEVHMLSTAAFNALLKTLEEPPDHVVFILCTTDPNKVPATIHSRCQRFDFHRISVDQIVARLGAVCVAEDVQFEPEALELIAERSEGGMRNALTSLEQLIVFSEGNVTRQAAEDLLGSLDSSDMAEIVGAIGRRDAAACFLWLANFVETGADLAQFARDLAEHIRALYIISLMGEDAPLEVTDAQRAQLMRELPYFGTDRLARALMILGDLMNELRSSENARLSFEIALTRLVHPGSDLTLESLAERIEVLEKAMTGAQRAQQNPTQPAVPQQGAPAPAAEREWAPDGFDDGFADVPDDYIPSDAFGEPSVQEAGKQAPPAPRVAKPNRETVVRPAPEPPVSHVPAQAPATPSGASQAQNPESLSEPSSDAVAPVAAAPAETPASTGGAVPSGLPATLANPASLQRGWQTTMAALKKHKAAFSVLFMNTQVTAKPSEGVIVVTFPATNKFAYMSVRKPEVYSALEEATVKGFGTAVTVQFEQEGSRGVGRPTPQAETRSQPSRPNPLRQGRSFPRTEAPQSPQPTAPTGAFNRNQAARPMAPGASRPMPPQGRESHSDFAPPSGSSQNPEFRPAAPNPGTGFGTSSAPAPVAPREPHPPIASPAQSPASGPASPQPGPDANASEEDAFASALAAGFGAGVSFEEVEDPGSANT